MAPPPMKLNIIPVPQPLWGRNLRSKEGIGDTQFRKLRKVLLKENGPACKICGNSDKPQAHEEWEYQAEKKTGVAKLIDVNIICEDCHAIHHWFRTEQWASPERLANLKAQFLAVNKCAEPAFLRHQDVALKEFYRQSKKRWSVDWGKFRDEVVKP